MAQRMSELDENHLRTLMSRFREQSPQEFIDLVAETFFIRADDKSVASFNHKDNDGTIDGTFVIFKGRQVAAWADEALKTWIKNLQEIQESTDEDDE